MRSKRSGEPGPSEAASPPPLWKRSSIKLGVFVAGVLSAALAAWLSGALGRLADAVWKPNKPPALTIIPGPTLDVSAAAGEGVNVGEGVCFDKQAFVINRPPNEVKAPPDTAASDFRSHSPYDAWDQRFDPADANVTGVSFSLQASPGRSVLITGITIRIIERHALPAPSSATVVGLYAGTCGGLVPTIHFHVSLDNQTPTVIPDKGGPQFPGYSLSSDEAVYFVLVGYTKLCDCKWVPEIHWRSDGKPGVTPYRPHVMPYYHTEPAPKDAQRLAWEIVSPDDYNSPSPTSMFRWKSVPFEEGTIHRYPSDSPSQTAASSNH